MYDIGKAIKYYKLASDQKDLGAMATLQKLYANNQDIIIELVLSSQRYIEKLNGQIIKKDQYIEELELLPDAPKYKEAMQHFTETSKVAF
jgi:hypothetical protein